MTKRGYSNLDKLSRSTTSGLSHFQLLIGLLLYVSVSPITQLFMKEGAQGNSQVLFFGLWHAITMIVAVILITIGAALAKRASTDGQKFKLTLIYFSLSVLMILIAIPWFRPLFRFI